MASGRIIASPAGARYFESLAPGRHGRQPGDSWRHPGDTETPRDTRGTRAILKIPDVLSLLVIHNIPDCGVNVGAYGVQLENITNLRKITCAATKSVNGLPVRN